MIFFFFFFNITSERFIEYYVYSFLNTFFRRIGQSFSAYEFFRGIIFLVLLAAASTGSRSLPRLIRSNPPRNDFTPARMV